MVLIIIWIMLLIITITITKVAVIVVVTVVAIPVVEVAMVVVVVDNNKITAIMYKTLDVSGLIRKPFASGTTTTSPTKSTKSLYQPDTSAFT